MLITLKKTTVRWGIFILFMVVFSLAACKADKAGVGKSGDSSEGATIETDGFTPLTLGLTPGNDTTELRFNWYSSDISSGKVAKIKLIEEGTAKAIEVNGTAIATTTGYTAHKVTVTALEPGCTYDYSVSNNGAVWSETYRFAISPAGSFRFAAITDPQIIVGRVDGYSRYPPPSTLVGDAWKETMEKIAATDACFIASMGDQVDNNSNNRNEIEYTGFFAPPGLRSLPFAPTVGNHDSHANFINHFNIPNDQFVTEGASDSIDFMLMGNYYYRYNNVLFVVLNTGAPAPSGRSQGLPYIERFSQVLQSAKTAHAGKYDWLIVQHHRSTASVAQHVADTDIQSFVEAGFETLMSEQKVDFVLAGHDHAYSRSYPLEGKDNGKASMPDKSQTGQDVKTGCTITATAGKPVYITFSTASGIKYYQVSADTAFKYNDHSGANTAYPYLGVNEDGTPTLAGSALYMQGALPVSNAVFVQAFIPSYCIVDVEPASITFKTYAIATKSGQNNGAQDGYSFDEATPYDSITVIKN